MNTDEYPAILIEQPLGSFYLTSLPVSLLLRVCYSEPLKIYAADEEGENVELEGLQRIRKNQRINEIQSFAESSEAIFPNTIILGVNYDRDDVHIEGQDNAWTVRHDANCGVHFISIPSSQRIASIIDGQHRLFGFYGSDESLKNIHLPCAVFIDLPKPYQAYIFATINFNQKKVDRSLAYELFGYSLNEDNSATWTPDQLAVFIARKLNINKESPFYGKIIVAPQNASVLFDETLPKTEWRVSMATIVDGVVKLFSVNPKRDRYAMHRQSNRTQNRTVLQSPGSITSKDKSVLRNLYIDNNDVVIYAVINNYFVAVDNLLWKGTSSKSYITKTVGVQALFDILVKLLGDFQSKKVGSVAYFEERLSGAKNIDFAADEYQSSGIGKARIRETIANAIGL